MSSHKLDAKLGLVFPMDHTVRAYLIRGIGSIGSYLIVRGWIDGIKRSYLIDALGEKYLTRID